MSETFQSLCGKVRLRCPDASTFLVEDWVRTAFQEIAEARRWSWLYGSDQFLMPAIYNTGTASVTRSSTIVTGTGTFWDTSMIGRQFRMATGTPIYTIQQVPDFTTLVLDSSWGGATASGSNYQIYLCYVTVPNDFQSFISVWDTNFNWQLLTDFTQNQLNAADAQRANSGNAYLLAWHDMTTNSIGVVAQPVQVSGSGSIPGSAGNYTGPNDALFTIEITSAGDSGAAFFQWKKDSGAYTTGVLTDAAALSLQDGVEVYFPAGLYNFGDVFVITAQTGPNPGSPRFEIWPHQQAQYVYPYLYWKKYPDISDPSVVIPRSIDSTLILERALSMAAMWPGPSGKPNSYYRLELSDRHMSKFAFLLNQAERLDNEVFQIDVMYQETLAMPFAPIPALGDSNWLQAHDW